MTEQPKAQYRHDYRSPDYTVTELALQFELDAALTRVTATSHLQRLVSQPVDLLLNGEGLTLISVEVDGTAWPHYQQEEGGLLLSQLPAECELVIINEISPAQNSALEGLYQSGDALCTQCESDGFRRITYFLDRPDVLARYRTRLIADKKRYPILLSNGNRVAQGELADGRHWVEWQDPFPKPSYLFALVAGDLDLLQDQFVTASGRTVALELYVDKGNVDRAHWAMTCLKNAMAWDEQRFNLEYDLDIYMLVAVYFFNMGAMENKGL
ncbi:MAG: M1 family aminopeptidase, partial [Enterobacteriaceae bacterium]